jgi:hypothetical protein
MLTLILNICLLFKTQKTQMLGASTDKIKNMRMLFITLKSMSQTIEYDCGGYLFIVNCIASFKLFVIT